jgi:hypothetical protein
MKNTFTATEDWFLPNAPTQNRQPDSRLKTPAKRRHRQTPPQPRLHFLLPESPPSELNFSFFRVERTAHSYSQSVTVVSYYLY